MRGETEAADEIGIWCAAGFVVGAVQVSGDPQAALCLGGANKVEDLRIAGQRFAGPVLGDLREQAMLDRVPLGGTGGVMSNGQGEIEAIAELGLEVGFPGPAAAPIAAASVGQDEQLPGAGVAVHPFAVPPLGDGMCGEAGRVVGDTDKDRAPVSEQIVDAVGDRHPGGIGAEVVVVHQHRRAVPLGAGVLEMADQFPLLGVDADHGEPLALETVSQGRDVVELLITVGAGISGQHLAIDAEGIVHLVKQTGYGAGGNRDTSLL